MRQFQVPQFIEVEDRIFGPLTLKQFLYILGGAAFLFLFYTFLPRFLMFIFAIPVGAFFAALAFYKINGQPFIKVLENALSHYSQGRLYIWKRAERSEKARGETTVTLGAGFSLPKLSGSKLKELAWELDIQERLSRQSFKGRSLSHHKDTS